MEGSSFPSHLRSRKMQTTDTRNVGCCPCHFLNIPRYLPVRWSAFPSSLQAKCRQGNPCLPPLLHVLNSHDNTHRKHFRRDLPIVIQVVVCSEKVDYEGVDLEKTWREHDFGRRRHQGGRSTVFAETRDEPKLCTNRALLRWKQRCYAELVAQSKD